MFDKTGTLTEGKLELVSVDVFQGDAQQAKLLAAALEQYSEHPVAAAFKPLPFCRCQRLTNLATLNHRLRLRCTLRDLRLNQ